MPVAEPTAARGARAVTDEDRLRAVHALQTSARMPPVQRRAELSKLPGMDGGNVDLCWLLREVGCMFGVFRGIAFAALSAPAKDLPEQSGAHLRR